jgi:type IV secretory pathway TrbL component
MVKRMAKRVIVTTLIYLATVLIIGTTSYLLLFQHPNLDIIKLAFAIILTFSLALIFLLLFFIRFLRK